MIERGEVKADDPLGKYMPEGAKIPSRNGHVITLVSLSQHTSALPTWPDNVDASGMLRSVSPKVSTSADDEAVDLSEAYMRLTGRLPSAAGQLYAVPFIAIRIRRTDLCSMY